MNPTGPKTESRLAEQTEALTLYLEALLVERPMSLPAVATPAAPMRPVIDLPPSALRVVAEAAPEVLTHAEIPASTAAAPAPASETATTTRPDWAAAPFPCLLLKVRGLSLALPLVKLHRILPWTEPTPIPGYVNWLLGMLRQDQDGLPNLKVVDTALLVMPELVERGASDVPPQHIVTIGDGEWGLTCESVSEVLTIDPAKVRWRTVRTKRPWLAGTAVEHLCALLDAEQLAEMLSAGTASLPP
jgi:purine-binding chemotaxis protein CheW